MRIVIDSNILFSALIKDSMTRKIIFGYEDLFLFPAFVFDEINKHKAELLKKSGMNASEFNKLLQLFLSKVEVVPNEITKPYMREAKELVKMIDPDDDVFVACTLAYPKSILWSNDRALKKIKSVHVNETKEIIKILYNVDSSKELVLAKKLASASDKNNLYGTEKELFKKLRRK